MALYKDNRIECREDGIRVAFYYFPVGSKTIPYSSIQRVEHVDMGPGLVGGRWRIWGSGDLTHWFHFDPGRPKKRHAFVFVVGETTRPVLTPSDPEAFQRALREKGIEIVESKDSPSGW